MANRSYVYTVDAVPTKKKRPKPIRSLSEFGWDIPLAFKILASEKPKRCQSLIWDLEIGVVARFPEGRERLLRFLDVLGKTGEAENAFDSAVAEASKALTHKKHVGKLVVLEAGEIFDLLKGSHVNNAKALVDEDIPAARKTVDAAIAGRETKWLAGVARTWEKTLGLYWADYLYFDFGAK
jgi:hypothetical protein